MRDSVVSNALFRSDRPIYTKIKDEPPTLYVKGCKVTNSLIADGCVIRGNVESSVIGRYVEIENDVTIHNCIILQNVRIHRNARLSNVIIDKNVDIDSGTELKGNETFPLVIEIKNLFKYRHKEAWNMYFLFVSEEVQPFIKTGGLADVSFALPKALREKGEDIRIILPKYGDISLNYTSKANLIASFGVSVGWRNQYCGLEYLNYDGIPVYFIDNEYYFKRPGCYGHFDDGERFAFFCRAVLESVKYMDSFHPDIIHCNDWQTGIIPVFLKDVYYDRPEFSHTRSVFTIHNLKYQGVFSPSVLEELLGLSPQYNAEDK